MYFNQSSKRTNFAPINAKRRKKRRIKKIFIFCTICIFIILLLWCFNKGMQYVFEHKSQWFTWHAKKLSVQAEDEYTKKQIENLINFKEDSIISGEDAKNIQNTILAKLPQVKEVKVKRGFFAKKLSVKAENHKILAKLATGQKDYLVSQTGVLFNYDKAQIPDDILQIKTENEIKGSFLPQELVKLLKDISKSSPQGLDYILVDLQQHRLTLYLKDGTVVAIGLFDLYNEKIAVLKDIIDISQKKGLKKPYKINFNYFKYGKVYLNSQV